MKELHYIIVGQARSGNTFTHLGIAEHPQVSACIDEVNVHPFYTQGVSVFTNANERPQEKERSHILLFRCLATLLGKQGCSAYGIHTVISSPQDAEKFVAAVQRNYPHAKIILIKRLNLLARLASLERAKKTGVYISWEKSNATEKMVLNEDALVHSLEESIKTVAVLETLRSSHSIMNCIYEYHIEKNNVEFLYEAFKFLELDLVDITWALTQKIAPHPSDFISGYSKNLKFALDKIMQMKGDSNYKNEVIEYLRKELYLQSA